MSDDPYLDIAELAAELWPNPEPTGRQLAIDAEVFSRSGFDAGTLFAVLVQLRAERTNPFRPTPAEILTAARRTITPARRDLLPLPAPPPPAECDWRNALASTRAQLRCSR